MKKLMKIFTIAMAIGLCGVLTSSAPVIKADNLLAEDCNEVFLEEEALFCKKANEHGAHDWCVFCNCANL